MENVFQIDEASPDSVNNRWLVKGRAMEELAVGETVFGALGRTYKVIFEPDKVYGILHEPEGGPTLYPFKIIAISAYGRDIDQLGAGLTGILILEGEHGETLMDTKYLVKC